MEMEWNEFETLMHENGVDVGDFLLETKTVFDADGVTYTNIEQDGGGEGGTEWCHTIVEEKSGDTTKFYKVTYNYYSHNGFEFDYADMSEVTPKTKTVTVYE